MARLDTSPDQRPRRVRAVSPADQARGDPSRDEDHELRLLVGDEVFAEMTRDRLPPRL